MKFLLPALALTLLASPASAQLRISQESINNFQQQIVEQQIQAEIAKLDTNKDNVISRKEYDAKTDELFRKLDTDQDGHITAEEREDARTKILQTRKSLLDK